MLVSVEWRPLLNFSCFKLSNILGESRNQVNVCVSLPPLERMQTIVGNEGRPPCGSDLRGSRMTVCFRVRLGKLSRLLYIRVLDAIYRPKQPEEVLLPSLTRSALDDGGVAVPRLRRCVRGAIWHHVHCPDRRVWAVDDGFPLHRS
ncbi:hypothetical protein AMTRI_Chr01g107480 [Amborella trichopoda]